MADWKLKNNGLKFLDSKEGDLWLVDSRLKMNLVFRKEFLEKAKKNPVDMAKLGVKFLNFLEAHEKARFEAAKKSVEELEDEKIKKLLRGKLEEGIVGVRRVEKSLYFINKK